MGYLCETFFENWISFLVWAPYCGSFIGMLLLFCVCVGGCLLSFYCCHFLWIIYQPPLFFGSSLCFHFFCNRVISLFNLEHLQYLLYSLHTSKAARLLKSSSQRHGSARSLWWGPEVPCEAALELAKSGQRKMRCNEGLEMSVRKLFSVCHDDVPIKLKKMRAEWLQ